MSLAKLLAEAAALPDGFATGIPEDWHQGRTAYGGFSATLALLAAMKVGGPDLPPLRSAQVSFVGPVFGEVEVRARLLRSGRNAIWIGADILRDGTSVLAASFVFMAPVDSGLHLDDRAAPADVIPPGDAEPFAMRNSPEFLRRHFEVRFALPRSAVKRPELCWWVRTAAAEGMDPMVGLMLVADALPPGVLPLLPPATPVSSMTWLCNLLAPAPATSDGWWLLRSTGDYAEHGCSSQRMAIWNARGEPVMAGMQSVALFG